MATKTVAKHQIALRRFYTGIGKGIQIQQMLGIERSEFIKHIDNQLLNRMTKESFGKIWGLDHIVPIELFDLNNIEELKLCWYYKNIMPMFINDNRKKGASAHFSIEKLNNMGKDEMLEKLIEICNDEINNT